MSAPRSVVLAAFVFQLHEGRDWRRVQHSAGRRIHARADKAANQHVASHGHAAAHLIWGPARDFPKSGTEAAILRLNERKSSTPISQVQDKSVRSQSQAGASGDHRVQTCFSFPYAHGQISPWVG